MFKNHVNAYETQDNLVVIFDRLLTFNNDEQMADALGIYDSEEIGFAKEVYFKMASMVIMSTIGLPFVIKNPNVDTVAGYTFSLMIKRFDKTHTSVFPNISFIKKYLYERLFYINTDSRIIYHNASNAQRVISSSNFTIYKDRIELNDGVEFESLSEDILYPIEVLYSFTISGLEVPQFFSDPNLRRAESLLASYYYRNKDGGNAKDFQMMMKNFNFLISNYCPNNWDVQLCV